MRRKLCLLLMMLLFLVSCSAESEPAPLPPSVPEVPYSREESPFESSAAPEPSYSEPEPSRAPAEEELFYAELADILWEIKNASDPEALLESYFELQYLSYASLREVDLRPILDMEQYGTYNLERWFNNLVQRRRLLNETGLCYVNTERYEYTITMIGEEDLDDIRMEFWEDTREEIPKEEITLHFVITGEPGKAYPPLMAVNSQHTVRMMPQEGGGWKITMHFFPGAVRKYILTSPLDYHEDGEVREELYEEFAPYDDTTALTIPAGARPYRGRFAVRYAEVFTERHNEEYYRVNEWYGNCQNFVSQCVLYGYGDGDVFDMEVSRYMDGEWLSGGGGGTLAWENVDFFWDYATSGRGMTCKVLDGPSVLRAGDIVETRNRYTHEEDDPDDYNHTLLVMDANTLLLAQNTPACYVYYSDLVNTAPRFIRPLYQ